MKRRGFTLLELMVVVSIVAVLAVTAVPIYHGYVNEAARAEANVTLVDIAAKEEAYYSAWQTYIATPTVTAPAAYTRTVQTLTLQSGQVDPWKQLGFHSVSTDDGGVFGGPTYYHYQVTIPANTVSYIVCGIRKLDDSEGETAVIRSTNRRAVVFTPFSNNGACPAQ